MSKTVEFFFDLGSPASYLAWTQLPALCAEHGARLVLRPMLLGGVFQATGNSSPVMIPAKARYFFGDLHRHAERYGVALKFSEHFPINTLALMRAATAVQLREPERFEAWLAAMYQALWGEGRNLGDPQVVAEVLDKAGFDAGGFEAQVSDPEVKAALKAVTEEAVARGVFGAPTCFVGDEMFFGQDRLGFIAEVLGR
ncbi:2-hydroxychromene-2-carboxylate isomerase [Pseudomonas japonica]|uniref:2-hydroxychromene-2-carboxylate isomerase n=1 Tax=Pseudomonas japonica TaxID=256466 RepID=UPI0038123B74